MSKIKINKEVRKYFEDCWVADENSKSYGEFKNMVEFAIRHDGGSVNNWNDVSEYQIEIGGTAYLSSSTELYHFFHTHK